MTKSNNKLTIIHKSVVGTSERTVSFDDAKVEFCEISTILAFLQDDELKEMSVTSSDLGIATFFKKC
jgi:hypothetical protein